MDTIAFDLSTTCEITAARVDDLARTRDTRVRLEDESTLFAEVTNVGRGSEEIREFVFARRFARFASELMGVRGVRLYHDQATIKDPGGSRIKAGTAVAAAFDCAGRVEGLS